MYKADTMNSSGSWNKISRTFHRSGMFVLNLRRCKNWFVLYKHSMYFWTMEYHRINF